MSEVQEFDSDDPGELPAVTKDDFVSSYVSGWDDDTEGVEEELNPHSKTLRSLSCNIAHFCNLTLIAGIVYVSILYS